jgi:hypothetical protein
MEEGGTTDKLVLQTRRGREWKGILRNQRSQRATVCMRRLLRYYIRWTCARSRLVLLEGVLSLKVELRVLRAGGIDATKIPGKTRGCMFWCLTLRNWGEKERMFACRCDCADNAKDRATLPTSCLPRPLKLTSPFPASPIR